MNVKINRIGKTRKHTRWKRGEFVVVEIVRKQSESEDGGMRELRERFEVVEVGKHSRRKGCQLVVIYTKNKRDKNEGGKEREME